ncbi:MAG: ribosomal protein S18-alanine N-acetyltransferase [Gemmatimonadetes bacterium]|nr:ribosomal protein S18-alanine N-acetyltransferase [Gemmatimonadota bacterium]
MATRVLDPEPAGSGASPEPVSIRPMTETDLPRVLEIERASFTVAWTPATFRGLLGRPDAYLHVAEVEGRVVGYTAVWVVLDQAELGDIAVDEAWRGKGIGQRLMAAVFDLVREQGVRELYLEVRVSNEGARRLYDRHGFRLVGRRPGYYVRPREDALVLRKVMGEPEKGSWP